MSRQQRLHLAGGFYSITLERLAPHPPLLANPNEYDLFESFLAEVFLAHRAKVHAFCWQPQTLRFVAEVDDDPLDSTPLCALMELLMRKYVNRVRRKRQLSYSGGPRHRAILIDPATYLQPMIRYLHWLPALGSDVGTPEGYSHSSHRAYLGRERVSWLTTERMLTQLSDRPDYAQRRYQKFMESKPTPQEIAELEGGSGCDPRVLGNRMFLLRLPREWNIRRPSMELQDVISSVCMHFSIDPQELYSAKPSSTHAMIRGMIAWQAQHREIATVVQVAELYGKRAPTLHAAIKRYKARHPELFTTTSFRRPVPIVPRAMVAQMLAQSETRAEESLPKATRTRNGMPSHRAAFKQHAV